MGEFEVTVCSDPGYEDLIAEVYFEGDLVALISQEKGYASLDVQLYPSTTNAALRFKLADFEAAIGRAKRRLWELRRVEKEPESYVLSVSHTPQFPPGTPFEED